MSAVYDYRPGKRPLLVSVPHDGRNIPAAIDERMTDAGRSIPDTDWHVAQLYDFAGDIGAHVIVAQYSRYVVDLNRSADDGELYPGQLSTGLCPSETFAGDPIYRGAPVGIREKRQRVRQYWQPYHDRIRACLDNMRKQHGHAFLWDAHSIPSAVPRLFDGELPVLNLGSNDTRSCDVSIEREVAAIAERSSYSSVLNGRFKGGFITRHYGDPGNNVHALQLEIAQRAYMDEESCAFDEGKAEKLRATLSAMLLAFQRAAADE